MSRTSLIAKNTFIQVLGRLAGTALGLATLAILTRHLGAHGYGIFTTVTTFLQFFGIIADFGLNLTVVSMLSEPNADAPLPDGSGRTGKDRIASNVLTFRVVTAAALYAIAPIVVLFFPYPPEAKLGVLVAALSFFFISVNAVLLGILQREMRMGRSAAAEVIGRIGLLAVTFAAVRLGLPIVWMFIALVVGNLLTVLWNLLLVRKLVRLGWSYDAAVWKSIALRSWPIAVSILFNLIYLKGGVILLTLFRSQEEVGVFGAAHKLLDVVTVIPIMFMGLVLPLLVKARTENSDRDWKRIMQKAFDFMAVMAFPLAAGTIAVGHDLMLLFAGPEFGASGDLLKILIFAAGAVFFGSLFGHAVVAAGKQKPMIWGYAADAVLSVIAFFILIPSRGAHGAAWVTVGSEIFMALATFIMIWRSTSFKPNLFVALKAAMSAMAMGWLIHLMPDMHVLLKVLAGAVLYSLFALATRAVTPQAVRELMAKPTNGV